MTLYIVFEFRMDLGRNYCFSHMYEVNNDPPVNLDMDDGDAVFKWLDSNYDPVLVFDGDDVDGTVVN